MHPGWNRLHGWEEVRRSWAAIFQSTSEMRFTITDVRVEVRGDLAWVHCTENIISETRGSLSITAILATNVFERHARGLAHRPPPRVPHPGAAGSRAGGRLTEARRLVGSLLASALTLLSGCGTALERSLIYHPSRTIEGTPAALGLAYEDVEVTTDDGVEIHGWLVPGTRRAAPCSTATATPATSRTGCRRSRHSTTGSGSRS